MNKKNSIVVVVIFAFLVSFLTLGNWGEPISKLEKTTENITQLDNFETPYTAFYDYSSRDIKFSDLPKNKIFLNHNTPSTIYNGMFHPLLNYSIKFLNRRVKGYQRFF